MIESLLKSLEGKTEVTFLVVICGLAGLYVWRVCHMTIKVPREELRRKIHAASAEDRRVFERAKNAAEIEEIESRTDSWRAITETQKVLRETQVRFTEHFETTAGQTQALISCAQEQAKTSRLHSEEIRAVHTDVKAGNEGIKELLRDRRRGEPLSG